MFTFKKSKLGLLPVAQEDQEDETREAMLGHEYMERKPQSRIRRILNSNVPWIITTVALSIYIFVFAPSPQLKKVAWSPTDVGEF
jgi:hypothetical protein